MHMIRHSLEPLIEDAGGGNDGMVISCVEQVLMYTARHAKAVRVGEAEGLWHLGLACLFLWAAECLPLQEVDPCILHQLMVSNAHGSSERRF